MKKTLGDCPGQVSFATHDFTHENAVYCALISSNSNAIFNKKILLVKNSDFKVFNC